MENPDETPIFDADLLKLLDYEALTNQNFHPSRSPQSPGESLVMRPLCVADYDKGFLELLQQLTSVGEVTREKFVAQFETMVACKDSYYVTVIEDIVIGKIVATGTLVVQQKFIHSCAIRGMIEEVIVHTEYRGKQLGKLLLDTLTLLSKHILGCYKTTLECTQENVNFYEKFGYKKDPQVFMQYRHKP